MPGGILYRIAIHLKDAIHEVQDPVVGEPGTRVEATLVLGIVGSVGNMNALR
jgi:hypothetical protein